MSNIFSEMKLYSKQNNVSIIISHLNSQYDKEYADELEGVVLGNDLAFVDLSSLFMGKDVREYMIYPTEIHQNGKANRIFAEKLYVI